MRKILFSTILSLAGAVTLPVGVTVTYAESVANDEQIADLVEARYRKLADYYSNTFYQPLADLYGLRAKIQEYTRISDTTAEAKIVGSVDSKSVFMRFLKRVVDIANGKDTEEDKEKEGKELAFIGIKSAISYTPEMRAKGQLAQIEEKIDSINIGEIGNFLLGSEENNSKAPDAMELGAKLNDKYHRTTLLLDNNEVKTSSSIGEIALEDGIIFRGLDWETTFNQEDTSGGIKGQFSFKGAVNDSGAATDGVSVDLLPFTGEFYGKDGINQFKTSPIKYLITPAEEKEEGREILRIESLSGTSKNFKIQEDAPFVTGELSYIIDNLVVNSSGGTIGIKKLEYSFSGERDGDTFKQGIKISVVPESSLMGLVGYPELNIDEITAKASLNNLTVQQAGIVSSAFISALEKNNKIGGSAPSEILEASGKTIEDTILRLYSAAKEAKSDLVFDISVKTNQGAANGYVKFYFPPNGQLDKVQWDKDGRYPSDKESKRILVESLGINIKATISKTLMQTFGLNSYIDSIGEEDRKLLGISDTGNEYLIDIKMEDGKINGQPIPN